MMGFDPITPSAQGFIIGTNNGQAAGTLYNQMPSGTSFSFCLPIACTLTNASTLWPLFCSQVQWEFQVADPTNYIATLAGTPTPTVSISNLNMVYNTLRLADGPFKAVVGMQPIDQDGNLVIKIRLFPPRCQTLMK